MASLQGNQSGETPGYHRWGFHRSSTLMALLQGSQPGEMFGCPPWRHCYAWPAPQVQACWMSEGQAPAALSAPAVHPQVQLPHIQHMDRDAVLRSSGARRADRAA